jgi:hypothetical protein
MNDSTPLCTCTRTRTPPRRSLASSTLCFYIAQHQHTVATRRPLAARPALHPSLSLCLSVCASLSNEGANLTTQTQRPLLVAQADVRAVFEPFALLVHDLHCAQACAYMHMPHALRSMHTRTQAPAAVCSRSVPHANAACYTYSHHAVGQREQDNADSRASKGEEARPDPKTKDLHHPPADEGKILLLEVERDTAQRDAAHTSTRTRTHARTHVRTHARTRARTRARAHTHTHTRTNKCTHPHTRTNVQLSPLTQCMLPFTHACTRSAWS